MKEVQFPVRSETWWFSRGTVTFTRLTSRYVLFLSRSNTNQLNKQEAY
jgi:hypothetical protein